MKQQFNVLSEELADEIYKVGLDYITMKYSGPVLKTWTNFAWHPDIVKDSAAVICIEMPNDIIKRIQDSLYYSGIFDPSLHKKLTETNAALIYVWTKDSYIPSHSDGLYSKAITIYLNRKWEYNDGGLFNWKNPKTSEWISVVPKFNMAMINDSGYMHGTTPVKSSQFRITAQIFLHPLK